MSIPELDPVGLEAAAREVLERYDDWSVNNYPADGGTTAHAQAWFREAQRVESAIENLRATYLSVQEQPDERETWVAERSDVEKHRDEYRTALERIAGMGGSLAFAGDVARAALAVRDTEQQETAEAASLETAVLDVLAAEDALPAMNDLSDTESWPAFWRALQKLRFALPSNLEGDA